jgi:NAD(P)-dependent dehydrogenase (short-subunit alcohol dehydrogenase family)
MRSPGERDRAGASRAVLVTGCSTGIGRMTAWRLHCGGWPVYATARRVDDIAELAAAGVATLPLDVTDEESTAAAVERVVAEHGAVGVLINNAGYALSGTVEEAVPEEIRAQFDTNVFGPADLIRRVLPGMRAQRTGLIVNVSSIVGRFGVPGGGFYQASKHALEALSDALRLEVAPFGIRVAVVEPGPVATPFADTAVLTLHGDVPDYREFRTRLVDWYGAVYRRARLTVAGTFLSDADDVARVIERVVRSRRARARYPVGPLARSILLLRRMLPDPMFDAFVRWQFPTP